MSNPFPPALPLPDDDRDADIPADDIGTTEVDGERRLDPDIDDGMLDSAEADRLASGADDADAL